MLALLAEMLSLSNDRRYPVLDLTPQQRRQRTLEALISQLTAELARQQLVLMIVEDAHWGGSGRAFRARLAGRRIESGTLPVLLIVTFRPGSSTRRGSTVACDEPDARAAWGARDGAAIIASLVGNKTLPCPM